MALTYLSGNRIQGVSNLAVTPAWEGDFDMSNPYSNGWTAEASNKMGLDAANNDISFTADASGTEENLVYDLQHADALDGSNAHATTWVLKFKITIDTYVRTDGAGNGLFIGLGSADSTVAAAAVQDFMGMVIWNSTGSGDQIVRTTWANNENTATNGTTIDSSTASGDVYYVTIIRSSDTAFSVRLTSDSDYTGTTNGGYQAITDVDASGVTNLRYFKLSNYSGGSGNPNDIIGRIEDLKFYNGTTDIADIDEKTTVANVPAGSRYEQTNDRKIFRLKATSGSGDVTWDTATNVGMTINGNTVTGTSASNNTWIDRARTVEEFYVGTGLASITFQAAQAGALGDNEDMGFGSGTLYSSGDAATYIEYRMHFPDSPKHIQILENNVSKGTNFGTWSSTKEYKITIDAAGVVRYYLAPTSGGTMALIYTSLVPIAVGTIMYGHAAVQSTGDSIVDVRFDFPNSWVEKGTA